MNAKRNLKIFLGRGGERLGPFSVDEIRAKLEVGEVGVDDAAWHAGLTGWSTLGQIMLSAGFFGEAPVKGSKAGIISVVFAACRLSS